MRVFAETLNAVLERNGAYYVVDIILSMLYGIAINECDNSLTGHINKYPDWTSHLKAFRKKMICQAPMSALGQMIKSISLGIVYGIRWKEAADWQLLDIRLNEQSILLNVGTLQLIYNGNSVYYVYF